MEARPAIRGVAAEPPSEGTWRRDIQGLRAVAVLLVVAFHAGLAVPGGFAGVDVFFVISGFVITGKLQREHATTGRSDLASFYAGRVRRILPALAIVVVAVAAATAGGLGRFGAEDDTMATGAAATLFAANVQLAASPHGYFDAGAETNALLHTWSLSVEEQFYLVVPLLLVVAWGLARRRPGRATDHGPLVVLCLVGGASFAAWVALNAHDPDLAFYASVARAWEFVAGALVALLAPRLAGLSRRWSGAISWGGALLVALPVVLARPTRAMPGLGQLLGDRAGYLPMVPILPVVGAAAVLAAGCSVGAPRSPLTSAPLRWIGDRSYGWYLWHWPVIVVAGGLVAPGAPVGALAAAIALLPAHLSYVLVEQPIRRDRRLVGRRAAGLAAACIGIPSLAVQVAPGALDALLSRRLTAAVEQVSEHHADLASGCSTLAPLGEQPPQCTWHVPSPRGHIVLLGDSNAGHFTEPVLRAGATLGYDVTVATQNACPFADVLVSRERTGGGVRSACRTYVMQSLETLEADPPSLVVLASAAPLYLGDTGGHRIVRPGIDASLDSPEERARALSAGTRSVLARLDAAGVPTVVVQTIPLFPEWHLTECATLRAYACPAEPFAAASRNRAQALAADALHAAVEGVPTSTLMDVADLVCPAGTCRAFHGEEWVYRDFAHLTVRASITLTPRFVEVFTRVLGPQAGGESLDVACLPGSPAGQGPSRPASTAACSSAAAAWRVIGAAAPKVPSP